MKLVITTQSMENYADNPVVENYWKAKGGDTIVVENISPANAERIKREGIPTLESLISYSNCYSSVSILGYDIVEDDEVVFEEWEAKNIASYNRDLGRWVMRSIRNLDYIMGVDRKIESWTMAPAGEREDFLLEYRMSDTGEWLTYDEFISRNKEAS